MAEMCWWAKNLHKDYDEDENVQKELFQDPEEEFDDYIDSDDFDDDW